MHTQFSRHAQQMCFDAVQQFFQLFQHVQALGFVFGIVNGQVNGVIRDFIDDFFHHRRNALAAAARLPDQTDAIVLHPNQRGNLEQAPHRACRTG